jgi:FAD/FMN-containing dehydrogenase/Fe-S oxidoreductase
MLIHIKDSWPARKLNSSEIDWDGDREKLERELRRSVAGDVRFDNGSRALYATDASNYRQIPIGLVIPRDKEDVAAAVEVCRRFGAPVLHRGGGTSLGGQCCNVAVVFDTTRYMHHVLEIDVKHKLGRVQPGCVLDTLRKEAKKQGLTYGPDPATHNHCTLGGMVGNNSCGVHAQMAGKTADNIHELEILTYDGLRMKVGRTSDEELSKIIAQGGRRGEIYAALRRLRDRYADLVRAKYPKIPRRVSGYNLDELLPENGFHVARALVGSECTCVTVLEITGNLVPEPKQRALLVLGYPDVFQAGDHVPDILPHQPIGLEGFDDRLIGFMRTKNMELQDLKLLPDGKGWLLVEFGADTRQEAERKAQALMSDLKKSRSRPDMKLFCDPHQAQLIWDVREAALGAASFVPGEHDMWPGWEDSAVPPGKVGPYLRDLKELLKHHGLDDPAVYGHFGQGCIHCRIPFELRTEEGLNQFRSFMSDAVDLVLSYGGSLSGEHGDGQARAEYLPRMFGAELVRAFQEFKTIWDPDWKMNPGKVVLPYKIDENLRLGLNYHPPQPQTHFQYPGDGFDFAKSTLRCVGVGKCRRESGGTMCPSYMVTREEMHSTRGRAHLLFEMMQGNPLAGGWKSEAVKEALDLCLSCKGCKGDCPVNVDIATYKSEFLSHYYEGRLRPRHAYASGFIALWAEMASKDAALANFFTQTPVLSGIAKLAAGYSQKRSIPRFAPQTFREWFRQRGPVNTGKPPVVLWPDTFNNYFTPKVAQAAVQVLERAGFSVKLPRRQSCCGRPLYDYGFLDTAKRWLARILIALERAIQAGIPVIGLGPSCVTVFRDELTNLFDGNKAAERLSKQTFFLSEFLMERVPNYRPPKLEREALVHGHCHHKAALRFKKERELLSAMGLDANVLDSGCCGMAGAFGYEEYHYEVSIQCGERVLLPAVRNADPDTLILADGFSCREQIQQQTRRKALHLAQVLQLAYSQRGAAMPVAEAEREYGEAERTPVIPAGIAAVFGGLAAGGAYLYQRSRRA